MANKKTPGVAKKKVNWKIYLRNTWQLYVMMLIPIIWLICFKYKADADTSLLHLKSITFSKEFGSLRGLVLNISRRHSDQVSSGLQ